MPRPARSAAGRCRGSRRARAPPRVRRAGGRATPASTPPSSGRCRTPSPPGRPSRSPSPAQRTDRRRRSARYRRAVASGTWRRPMTSRDTDEEHRASTPLELLFDLCFVVAVAAGRRRSCTMRSPTATPGSAVVSYVLVFFAIWWAWMNFTWFSSAYDNDDVVYRLLTLVQITGVLILAAGVPRAFEHRDFDVVFVGYLVMRVGLVTPLVAGGPLRPRTAARPCTGSRRGSRCAWSGGSAWRCSAGRCGRSSCSASPSWRCRCGPSWRRRHRGTPRTSPSATACSRSSCSARPSWRRRSRSRRWSTTASGDTTVVLTAVGALLTVFSMWWLYFAKPAARVAGVEPGRVPWGYGHYVVFAAAAAVGAGRGGDGRLGHAPRARVRHRRRGGVHDPGVLYVVAVVFIQTLLFGVHRLRTAVWCAPKSSVWMEPTRAHVEHDRIVKAAAAPVSDTCACPVVRRPPPPRHADRRHGGERDVVPVTPGNTDLVRHQWRAPAWRSRASHMENTVRRAPTAVSTAGAVAAGAVDHRLEGDRRRQDGLAEHNDREQAVTAPRCSAGCHGVFSASSAHTDRKLGDAEHDERPDRPAEQRHAGPPDHAEGLPSTNRSPRRTAS